LTRTSRPGSPTAPCGGFEAVHVADLGLVTASDDEIFDRATADGLTVVTADSDIGMLLALRRATSPSIVHLRHMAELAPEIHVGLLSANLPQIADDLDRMSDRLAESDATGGEGLTDPLTRSALGPTSPRIVPSNVPSTRSYPVRSAGLGADERIDYQGTYGREDTVRTDRRPLKVATWVRIPLGVPEERCPPGSRATTRAGCAGLVTAAAPRTPSRTWR
jgi:predicted nuclease of predicted toxin-antitoxin system